jgi:ankyrin repeat protein
MQKREIAAKKKHKAAKTRQSIIPSEKPKLSIKEQERLDRELLGASSRGNSGEIARLLKVGAHIDATDEEGWTPLMKAIFFGKGLTETCRILIEMGADVNAELCRGTWEGKTALIIAAERGYTDICRMLIDRGVDVNYTVTNGDWWGTTPLLIAAHEGQESTCRFLIERGAEIDVADEHGATPVINAAKCNGVGTCKLLLDAIAKKGEDVKSYISACDNNNKTPLMHAAYYKVPKTCALLLGRYIEAGGDVNDLLKARDCEKKTALMHAKDNNITGDDRTETISILRLYSTTIQSIFGREALRQFFVDFRACTSS